jgi:hypothetical protein
LDRPVTFECRNLQKTVDFVVAVVVAVEIAIPDLVYIGALAIPCALKPGVKSFPVVVVVVRRAAIVGIVEVDRCLPVTADHALVHELVALLAAVKDSILEWRCLLGNKQMGGAER